MRNFLTPVSLVRLDSGKILMFQLLTLQLAMLALASPQAEQRLGSVSGIVVRLGANEPVSDVDVELTRLEGTAAYPLGPPVNPPGNFSAGALVARTAPNPADISNLRTRSDGLFNFKDLKPGVYRLLAARGDGTYFPAEYGQRHPRGRGFNFTLTEGQAMASVKLEMAPTGSISGRVIDADGVPAARVRAMALEAVYQSGRRVLGLVQATNTDDRGDYRLFWLPPGRYYIAARPEDPKAGSIPLVVTPPGRGPMRETFGQAPLMHRSLSNGEVVEETYELAYRGGGADSQRAQALDLAPGANINGIDIPLADSRVRARRIRGVVIDGTTGQPAGSVSVRAIPSNPGPSVILPGTTTAANGSFEISGAGPGPYIVRANLGTAAVSGIVHVDAGNANVENLKIVMTPGFTLSGRVIVEGAPSTGTAPDVSGILIGITSENPLLPSPVVSRPDSITGVQPGDYRMSVVTTGGSPSLQNSYVKSIRLGLMDILNDGLHITGPPEGEFQIVLGGEGGRLEGRVLDDRGLPVINAAVVLIPDIPFRRRPDLYSAVNTGARGGFRMSGIAPGNYKVFAWPYVESGMWFDEEFMRAYESRGKPIRIVEGNNPNIDVTPIPD